MSCATGPLRSCKKERLQLTRTLYPFTGRPHPDQLDGSFVTDKLDPNDVDVVVMSEADFRIPRCFEWVRGNFFAQSETDYR